jgi:hypothetical protein
MNEQEAIKIQEEIEQICIRHGIWCNIEHEKKPDLKTIRVIASIKIIDK